ncbi:MAG TPA: alpha/beta hydrolase [Streptosporangiaceae bacterium]|nr:alpha/beta hydrolase [Streptosporangiaceae bacterium]
MNITRIAQPRRLRLIIAAVIVAMAGLVIPFSQIASARTAEAATAGDGTNPTIVLVHGAWADTGSWAGVIKRLQADGYTVYAPPNPLQGLAYDPAYLADFLHSISGPIVLVGHSYGGAVITNAATGDPQVKALVYVDAFAPAQGQTLAQLLAAHPGTCAVPANLNVVPFPGAPSGVGDAYIKQSVFPSCMANGLPATEANVLAVTQLPLSTIALTQPTGVPAWQTIPSWAVVGTADHAIPLALQLAMANTAHAHITKVDAPHLSMISDPGTVTSVILQAVRATS